MMENKVLIDLSIKYGLDSSKISELVDLAYQAGVPSLNSREFTRIADFICESNLLGNAPEEILEELKRKGLIK